MNKVSIQVGGTIYEGWKDISVDKAMDWFCGRFSFTASDKHPFSPSDWGIKMGDYCKVLVDESEIMTGWVETIEANYSKSFHNLKFEGREKTADLVDCAYVPSLFAKNEWIDTSVVNIITDLCNPFPVDVVVDADPTLTTIVIKRVEKFKANEGDKLYSLIGRLCKEFAIIPICYEDGNLTLSQAGVRIANDPLKVGKDGNILQGRVRFDTRNRFSYYVVRGQGIGFDEKTTEEYTQCEGIAEDPVVTRYRPIMIHSDAPTTSGQSADKADWEARKRAGASREIEYTVQGWVQSNGEPWSINSLVEIEDPVLEINDTRLISKVTFRQDDSEGTVTRLTISHPGKYALFSSQHPIAGMKEAWDA